MKVISILATLSLGAIASASPVDAPPAAACCPKNEQPICVRDLLDLVFPVQKCNDECKGATFCCETRETVVRL
jgi:hypothetical protein